MQHFTGAEVRTTVTSLAISASPEARLVVYTPITENDAVALAELTTAAPTSGMCEYHEALRNAPAT
jgi:hypothetical protein